MEGYGDVFIGFDLFIPDIWISAMVDDVGGIDDVFYILISAGGVVHDEP